MIKAISFTNISANTAWLSPKKQRLPPDEKKALKLRNDMGEVQVGLVKVSAQIENTERAIVEAKKQRNKSAEGISFEILGDLLLRKDNLEELNRKLSEKSAYLS